MKKNWWKQIRYFKSREFDSPGKPGSGLNMKREAVITADKIRKIIGVPLHINSGFRTPARNKLKGGKLNSAHVKGWGFDIRARSSHIRFLIIRAAIKLDVRRIGVAKTFIHLDIDPGLPQEVFWMYK